jgi:hypothetical protein
MNYYAQGGQPYGLNSLADTDYYSRGVQYKDGIPSFGIGGSLRKAWKGTVGKIEDVAKPITKPITDAVKPLLPYVQYVAPFIPGVGPLMAAGLGALGSGFAGGGGFNFKRGLMGGMTAYGLSNLYAGMQAAGGAGTTGASAATAPPPVELGVPGTEVVAGEVAQTGLRTPGVFDQVMAGDFSGAASTVGQNIGEGISSGYNAITNPNTYANMGDKFATQMSDAGQGLKNLTGVGDTTMTAKDAASAFGKKFGTGSAMGIYGGVTGAQALDEYDEMKNQADLAAAKNEAERAAIMDRIEQSRQRGIQAMRANPYMFAQGGSVDDEAGFDDFNYMDGGIAAMARGGMPPRFLSGGGDGMSDDIKATINDKQPARLADGEFVIPADVVSHLGNGSSKAGAKKLYSMMDRVRHARTGTKKQGKQINPNKFLLA